VHAETVGSFVDAEFLGPSATASRCRHL
jgi:hypothetical protein